MSARDGEQHTPDVETADLKRQLADHKASAQSSAMAAASLGAEVQRLRRELDRANRCISCLRERLAETDQQVAAAEGNDRAPTLCSH